MTTRLNAYLAFGDQAKQAMEFYKTVFGGSLDMTTFADGGMPHDPDEADKIMHAMLTTENGMVLMASDTPGSNTNTPPQGISLSLSGDNKTQLTTYWTALSDGGTVTMPFEAAPWGDIFGMVTDKFGISWMVNVTPAK